MLIGQMHNAYRLLGQHDRFEELWLLLPQSDIKRQLGFGLVFHDLNNDSVWGGERNNQNSPDAEARTQIFFAQTRNPEIET